MPFGHVGYRSQWRKKAHAAAAAEAGDSPPAAEETVESSGATTAGIPRAAPEWVDRPERVAEIIAGIPDDEVLAFDTEFIGETTYAPLLCVVQLATADHIWLLDPQAPGMSEGGLQPLWDLLVSGRVQTVVHAGMQDTEHVFRATRKPPARVVDTQVLAGFCRMNYPAGLAKVLQQVMGIRLAKAWTFSQWDVRPLTKDQMKYAADDVRYLPALYVALKAHLQQGGTWEWAAAECATLSDPGNYAASMADVAARMRGYESVTEKCRPTLVKLCEWRDGVARGANVPVRVVAKDEVLIDLARQPVKGVAQLSRVKGLVREVIDRHGEELMAALEGAVASRGGGERPDEPTPGEKFNHETVWAAATLLAAGHGVDMALVASRAEVGRWYKAVMTGDAAAAAASPLTQGWRASAVGEELARRVAAEAKDIPTVPPAKGVGKKR
jgi:ribonuclease D